MTSKDKFIKDKVYEFGVRFGIKIADEQDLNAMLMAVYVQGVNDNAPFEWHKGRKIEAEETLAFITALTPTNNI